MPRTPGFPVSQHIRFTKLGDPSDPPITYAVKAGETIQSIVSSRGYPSKAREVARLNHFRHTNYKFKGGRKIKLPGYMQAGDSFIVLSDDGAPTPTGGYAKFNTLDRPGRVGVTVFAGYDPMELQLPIRFENFQAGEGVAIERDIAKLEGMAGRGKSPIIDTPGVGPPPLVMISSTTDTDANDNARGETVPLIPHNYQADSKKGGQFPLYVVTGLDWDGNPLRSTSGNRLRQTCMVTVTQFVDA